MLTKIFLGSAAICLFLALECMFFSMMKVTISNQYNPFLFNCFGFFLALSGSLVTFVPLFKVFKFLKTL